MAQYGHWHIDIIPWMRWKSSTTMSPTRTNDSTALGMAYANAAAGVAGAHIEWDAALTDGTWTLTVIYAKGPASGIITASIDGVDLAPTFDAYAAAGTFNQVVQWTGIVVSTAGNKEVKFRADTKNASSSNYGFAPQLINFTRTA